MANEPDMPDIGADTGGFPAYHPGSGPAFGTPETAFPKETFLQKLERVRPISPKSDPDVFRKPDDTTGMDRRGEFDNTPWNSRKPDQEI